MSSHASFFSPGRAKRLAQPVLTSSCVVFLFVMPFTSSVAVRNSTLGMALIAALAVVRFRHASLPQLPRSVLAAVGAWAMLGTMSWLWSVDPIYTAHELKSEVLLTLIAFGVFFVGAEGRSIRIWCATLLAVTATLGALAIGEFALTGTWQPSRWHAGVGAYSTWLTMVFPLVLTLALPPPALSVDPGRLRWPVFALLVALVVGSASLTLNRIVWPSFATTLCFFCVLGLATPWADASIRRRLLAIGIIVLLGLGSVFALVSVQKARISYPDALSADAVIAHDARIKLWWFSRERILEAPLAGHGFGRGILRREMQATLGNPLLWHGHNLVLNALLQTGIVGLLALVSLFATIARRYFVYLRAPHPQQNALGVLGLAFLAGFLVKNMTDDFLVRHTGLLFWAFNGMLLGYGERLMLAVRQVPPRSLGDYKNSAEIEVIATPQGQPEPHAVSLR